MERVKDIKSNVEEYYNKYPNATLQDYISYLQDKENKEIESKEQVANWYKTLVGKFFYFSKMYIAVKMNENNEIYMNEICIDILNLEENDKWLSMSQRIEDLYESWFKNPFKDDYSEYELSNGFAIEIDEEEYRKVETIFNKYYKEIQKEIEINNIAI